MIDDERPDAPDEGTPPDESASPAPTAGDESLSEVEDTGEQITDSPDADAADDTRDVDAPNESAPGHTDPAEAQDAEPSAAASEADAEAPNGSAPGRAEPPAEADAERPRRERRRRDGEEDKKEEVVPGAHLEPDLVLEEGSEAEADEYADRYAPATEAAEPAAAEAEGETAQPEAPAERPAPRSVLDLAADARYQATGKRKTSVARVILKPGDGAYTVNGRSLEDYFPRAALQKAARQPLQTAGFEKRMDVSARIHGGGISAQAGALRHGVARALVEADPSLRVELKRRGYLSRDARAKERKKAGLKKARKRPQFSKR